MKFNSVAEAFNYYRNHDIKEIEKRAAEIGNIIDTDPNADIRSLNIELDGLKEAKENIETRAAARSKVNIFNPITGMNYNDNNKVEMPEGEAIFATKEYRSAFFKNLLGHKLTEVEQRVFNQAMTETRADAFNTTTNAAAVLPTATLDEVISKARKKGGLLGHCRNFNLPTNIRVPIATPSNKAAWHTEGDAVETEKANLAYVSFGGYEIIKIFSISAATQRMSIAAFESYLVDELVNSVMETIEDSIINGEGSTEGTGLETITWTKDTNAIEYSAIDGLAYTDITAALGLLKRGYGANAKFAMNNATLYKSVYGLVDANGRPIFIQDPKNEAIGYILGKEVVIDDNIADGDIYLGNFDYMGYNIPQGILIEVSRESSFKSGLIDYRALAIADTKPLVAEAFVKLYQAEA